MSCSRKAAVFLGVIAACLWSVRSQVPQFGQQYTGDVSAPDCGQESELPHPEYEHLVFCIRLGL